MIDASLNGALLLLAINLALSVAYDLCGVTKKEAKQKARVYLLLSALVAIYVLWRF